MKVKDISPEEYHPYFKPYIEKVGNKSLLKSLKKGKKATISFFKKIPKEKLEYRYEEGKWTIKDILLHIVDAERAFNYRALQFARSKEAKLEGFDENEFVANAEANSRSVKSLLKEYNAVRNSTIQLYKSFSKETLKRTGTANNTSLSVRAAGFLACGHEIHHKQTIKERYL